MALQMRFVLDARPQASSVEEVRAPCGRYEDTVGEGLSARRSHDRRISQLDRDGFRVERSVDIPEGGLGEYGGHD